MRRKSRKVARSQPARYFARKRSPPHVPSGAKLGSKAAARGRLTSAEARAVRGVDFTRAAKEARAANRAAARAALAPLPRDASKAQVKAREKLIRAMRAPGIFRETARQNVEKAVLARGVPRSRAARARLARAAGMRAYWQEVHRVRAATGKSTRDARILVRVSRDPSKAAVLGKLGETLRSGKKRK